MFKRQKIAAGLREAIAFAKGDESTARITRYGRSKPIRDQDGPAIDPYGIMDAGQRGGANPYGEGTFEWSLFEDGRRQR